MSKKKELIEGDSVGYIDLQLSSSEIRDLINVLAFAVDTTKFIYDQEMIKGTWKAAAKYNTTNQKACDLLELIIKASRIGYTDIDKMH